MKRAFLLSAAIAIAVLSVALGRALDHPSALAHHLVMVSSTYAWTLAELAEAADIVAVVRPAGKDHVHWNNDPNVPWTSEVGRAMIYNDQEVDVTQVLSGEAPARLTIRNIGGTVGDTMFEFEGLEPLSTNSEYLVFLEMVLTPTQTGQEWALSFVAQQQGVFSKSGVEFVNPLGLRASLDTLAK